MFWAPKGWSQGTYRIKLLIDCKKYVMHYNYKFIGQHLWYNSVIQVVILGEKINAHLRLHQKIYLTLDRYSPTLQHHPGVSTMCQRPYKMLMFFKCLSLLSHQIIDWVLNRRWYVRIWLSFLLGVIHVKVGNSIYFAMNQFNIQNIVNILHGCLACSC